MRAHGAGAALVTFDEQLARLEAIAAELQGDAVPLDRAMALFEEGVERLRAASDALVRAEARVARLVEKADATFALKPLGE
jgi:exodeoxyribonuclease VII small subunit